MRIKNKKTGELIEVPPHLESDVKAIIAKGGDPMVILNIDIPKAQTGKRIPFTDEYGNQIPQDWGNNIQPNMFVDYLNRQNNDPNYMPYIEQRPQEQFTPIQPLSAQQGLPQGQLSTNPVQQPFYENADATQEQGGNPMGIINTIVKAASQIEPLARNAWTSLGNHIKNRRTQAYEAKQLNKAYRQPYNTNFSEDRFGTNQGLQLFEMGGINNYKTMNNGGIPNVEVEGGGLPNKEGEYIMLPNGYGENIHGAKHSEGGVPMNLEEGSLVFTANKKMKNPLTGNLYSRDAKKYETKKDFEHLESPISDNINKKTAQLNINLKAKEKVKLFNDMETRALNGEFGKKIQKEKRENYEMKYGGKLPKAQSGINWLSPHISKTPEGKTTPTNLNLQGTPPQKVDWENVANQWMEINPNINSPLELQEEMYDYWLDKYQLGNAEEKQGALSQFKKMWGIFGDVKLNKDNPPKGISKNWQNWKIDDKSTLDDLSRLRGNFIDSKLEARHFLPMSQPAIDSPKTTSPADGDTVPVQKEKPLSPTKSSFNIPQAIPIPLGNIYGKDPVARFEIPNREVPFRRMSPQQQINEINRNSRAALSLLGNTPTDVSNISNILTQADIQSANVIDQVNRGNIQSQMSIDQFNTQLGRQRDLSQLQEDVRFTDAIARREAAIQGQYLLDRNQGMQDLSDIFKEQRYMDFAEKVYPSKAWENMNLLTYDPNKFDLTPREKKEKKSYGGKIKINKKRLTKKG